MVHGRPGLYLEAWKFSVYIAVPIVASVYYSNPETQKYWADYWQFVKYPENPNTNVKEQIEALIQERKRQEAQGQVYREQLKQLHVSADRSKQFQAELLQQQRQPIEGASSELSWWRRAGRWVTGGGRASQ
jgi:Pet100